MDELLNRLKDAARSFTDGRIIRTAYRGIPNTENAPTFDRIKIGDTLYRWDQEFFVINRYVVVRIFLNKSCLVIYVPPADDDDWEYMHNADLASESHKRDVKDLAPAIRESLNDCNDYRELCFAALKEIGADY